MSSGQLIKLTYISKSTQNMGVLALMRLIDQAVKDNKKLGLTGILFYENQHFGQILEGPKSKVTSLWEKIKLDTRHHQVRLLEIEEIHERRFPDWYMKFIGGKEIAEKIPSLLGILDGLPEHDVELLTLMRLTSLNN